MALEESILIKEISDLINKLDDVERQADSSIKGYFYQVDVTLQRILDCKDANKKFYIEKIEDILEVGNVNYDGEFINIVQVKHHEKKTTNSTYYKPILYFYLSFLKIKEKNIEDKFKFTLIKYDESNLKDVRSVLNDGLLKSKDNEKLREKINIFEKKIKINRKELFDKFEKVTTIIHLSDYSKLINENIDKLKYIKNEKDYEMCKNFYGFLWIYLKDNFLKNDFSITREKLLNVLEKNMEKLNENLQDKNWQQLQCQVVNIDKKLNDIDVTTKNTERIIQGIKDDISILKEDKYNKNIKIKVKECIHKISDNIQGYDYDDEIYNNLTIEDIFCRNMLNEFEKFIDQNLNSINDEKYFLLSIMSKYSSEGDLDNLSTDELNKNEYIIESYIIRLIEIYYYLKFIRKDISQLNELIYIDNKKIWHLKFIHKDKGEIFISLLGGEDKDPKSRCSELNLISRKYENFYDDKYPDLLLYKSEKRGLFSRLDISKYKDQPRYITKMKKKITKIERDICIKCLSCLEENEFDEYGKCENLFNYKCGGEK